jgi:hypothetical protein
MRCCVEIVRTWTNLRDVGARTHRHGHALAFARSTAAPCVLATPKRPGGAGRVTREGFDPITHHNDRTRPIRSRQATTWLVGRQASSLSLLLPPSRPHASEPDIPRHTSQSKRAHLFGCCGTPSEAGEHSSSWKPLPSPRRLTSLDELVSVSAAVTFEAPTMGRTRAPQGRKEEGQQQ